jgi:hypothetical protein
MSRAHIAAGIVAAIAIGSLAYGLLFWRVEARHSSPYGFSKTIDFDRLIAVSGGYVTANYPDFDRVDLDLRAYNPKADYDLTIHIRPATAGATDVRTIGLDVHGSEIDYVKGAFANPFTSIRFDRIADSAGQTYYVWVERGPRNQDDVITVWSIKSYSTVPARSVMASILDRVDRAWYIGWLSPIMALAGLSILGLAVWTVWAMTMAGLNITPNRGVRRPAEWQGREADGIQSSGQRPS